MTGRRSVLVASRDPVVVRALERVAPGAGLHLSIAGVPPAAGVAARGAPAPDVAVVDVPAPDVAAPDVAVVDLDSPGAMALVRSLRRSFPDAFVAGHSAVPDRDLWLDAERAGCDLVTNRGSLAGRLVQKLPPPGRPRRERLAVAESADLPGRIGVVARHRDTPVGPVAVYQVRGGLWALADVCPHAGAPVSTGELEETVVTCPAHGSQFDVCTGARLRGPADCGLQVFEVVEEDGLVYLLC